MSVNKIDDAAVNRIRRKSATALPDRPSERGIKAPEVKKAFFGFVTDEENSVVSEINRIVEEINSEMTETNGKVDAVSATKFYENSALTAIEHKIVDNEYACYTADGITNVKVIIPEDIAPGFSSGMFIKHGETAPAYEFVNQSNKKLRLIQYCASITTYFPQPNCDVRILFDCDEGTTVCVWIVEVV